MKTESNSGHSSSKIKTDSGIKIESEIKIESNNEHSNSKIKTDSGIKIESEIKIESAIKTESNNEHSNNEHSNSKIKTDSGIKIEGNSGHSKSKSKMGNTAGRNSSVNRMPRLHVRIMNGKSNRGTLGSSIEHVPGIPSTALGRTAAAIAATASLTTGSAAPLVRIMRSESTAVR